MQRYFYKFINLPRHIKLDDGEKVLCAHKLEANFLRDFIYLFIMFILICAGLVNAAPVKSQNEAIKLVKKSMIKHNIYSVKNENDFECLRFYINENVEEFEIDVRSNNEKCGGDPNVEPRLFSYIVNKKTGKLATDSFEYAEKQGIEWDGEYLPID